MEIRLQKYFTDCGALSRRAAENEIAAGRVLVNGTPAAVGQKIDPARDTVEWRGRPLTPPADGARHYLLLNKPRGFVTTLSDEKGRRTVAQLVGDFPARVYPVGRLDMDSDGLLLLTDDGALCALLTHPRHELPRHYRVWVRGEVSAAVLARLGEPFTLDGYTTRPAQITLAEHTADGAVLAVTLFEGRNRQIRRMCAAAGLHVTRLSRVALGDLSLGNLAVGHWRELSAREVAYLKGETSL